MKEGIDKYIENQIKRCFEIGVVLDYVVLECDETISGIELHRQAAIEGMKIIDSRLAEWALEWASEEIPMDQFFRIKMNPENLEGRNITFEEFWGNDNAFKKEISSGMAWSIPSVDGYKTAFFNPPHDLRGKLEDQIEIFEQLNEALFGEMTQSNLNIYSWTVNWSNYFDAGKEWWGSFYWTLENLEKSNVIVIGASSTD